MTPTPIFILLFDIISTSTSFKTPENSAMNDEVNISPVMNDEVNMSPAVSYEPSLSFEWTGPMSLRLRNRDGDEDDIELRPAKKIGNFQVDCLFVGHLAKDKGGSAGVVGCQQSSETSITIVSNYSSGTMFTLFNQNKTTLELLDTSVINTTYEEEGEELERHKRSSYYEDGVSYDYDIDDYSFDGGESIPPNVYYEFALSYDQAFLTKMNLNTRAAEEYITKVATLAQIYFKDPSLGAIIHFVMNEDIRYLQGKEFKVNPRSPENKSDIRDAQTIQTSEPLVIFAKTDELESWRGVATNRKACNPSKARAIIKHRKQFQRAALTMAHEMGHWFANLHDGEQDKKNNRNKPKIEHTYCKGQGIMTDSVIRPKEWSECSRQKLAYFYTKTGHACLKTAPACINDDWVQDAPCSCGVGAKTILCSGQDHDYCIPETATCRDKLVSTWEQNKSYNCWKDCGEKGGKCQSFCGSNGYCCRKGYDGCPPGAGKTSPKMHTCVTKLDHCYGTIKENGWYGGSLVVDGFREDNAFQCGKSCCENENCKIWVWRSSDKMCHLKNNDNPTWQSLEGHWSAKRKDNQCYGTIKENGWYAGTMVGKEFKQDNAFQCGKRCCDNENCKVWVWRSKDKMCHLKKDDNLSWISAEGHWSAKDSTIGCLTTPSSTDKNGYATKGNKKCIFPFSFDGKTYNGCAPGTAASNIQDDTLWCATKVDSTGNLVLGEFGFCEKACPGNTNSHSGTESGCFPGSSLVMLEGGEKKRMNELRIGDAVITVENAKLVSTTVLGFLDKRINQTTEYLKFNIDNGRSLWISPRHNMFIKGDDNSIKSVLAKEVNPGDMVVTEKGFARVQQVTAVLMDGAYVPLTNAGTLIVDGVLVSCYSNSYHWLAHNVLAPLRLWPAKLLDNEESQHIEGIRTYPWMVKKLGYFLGLAEVFIPKDKTEAEGFPMLEMPTPRLTLDKIDKDEL